MADTTTAPTTEDTQSEMKELIQATSALNESEKSYWLNLLPNMSPEQIEQLKSILKKEEKNLEEVDQQYDEKLEQTAQKYLNKWDSEKARAQRVERKAEEAKHLEEDHAEAESLLENW